MFILKHLLLLSTILLNFCSANSIAECGSNQFMYTDKYNNEGCGGKPLLLTLLLNFK